MNFSESESYLLSLGNEVSAIKLGLDNIRRLLTALGNPQNNFLKVQVAGTNGKGSVCAFLNAICLEAGVKTGLYTSPHLVSITERIKINGIDINENDFARHASLVRETAERLLSDGDLEYRPTFFEQVTAISLIAFVKANIELAILETGLGGRLDATTAANAEIAAITRIDYDHQEYLGNTIEAIAAEKAAIIQANTEAVVVGNQNREVHAVIEDRILQTKGGNPTCGEGAQVVSDLSCAHSLPLVFPPSGLGLKGRHQVENADVAVAVADKLRSRFTISDDHILTGLANARHPGRLEFSGRYLFDGAHNVAGAKALRDFLDEFVDQPITMIFGSMKDKPIAEIAEILFPTAKNLILTQPENSRAMSAADIAAYALAGQNTILTDTVDEALRTATEVAADDGLTLITGSLYLIGEAKKILNNC